MKQVDAEYIAKLFHDAEAKIELSRRAARDADTAMKALHKAVTPLLPALGSGMGIDVTALSGGGPK